MSTCSYYLPDLRDHRWKYAPVAIGWFRTCVKCGAEETGSWAEGKVQPPIVQSNMEAGS